MSFYKFNKILDHKDLLIKKNNFRTLKHVRIEPTEVCNFQCAFCVTQDPLRKQKMINQGYDSGNRKLDFNRFLDLLDELKEVGVEAISFTAVGDPLVYPKIGKIFEKALNLNFKLGLTSNFAMKINDELIETLSKFSWLRWSMNGGSEDVYYKTNRPKGKLGLNAYHDVKKNINRIVNKIKTLNSNTKINASYVISEWNLNDTENAAKLAKELMIDSVFFRPDMELYNKRDNNLKKIMTNNDEIISKAKKFDSKKFKVFIEYDRESDSLEVSDPDLKCFYSNHSIYIAANGDVYPCCYTRMWKKYAIDNINSTSFTDFWRGKHAEDNYKKLDTNECPTCPYIDVNKALKMIYDNKDFDKNKTESKYKNHIDPFI